MAEVAVLDTPKTEEELFNTLSGLPYFVLTTYTNAVTATRLEFDDLLQEMRVEALKAVRVYMKRPERQEEGALSTLAVRFMKNRLFILARMQKSKKRDGPECLTLDDPEHRDWAEDNAEETAVVYPYSPAGMDLRVLVSQARETLTPNEVVLFDALVEGRSLVSVAEEQGCAPQTIQYHLDIMRGKLSAFREALLNG